MKGADFWKLLAVMQGNIALFIFVKKILRFYIAVLFCVTASAFSPSRMMVGRMNIIRFRFYFLLASEAKKRPMSGISPRTGTLKWVSSSCHSIRPPETIIAPSFTSTSAPQHLRGNLELYGFSLIDLGQYRQTGADIAAICRLKKSFVVRAGR
jgi:hypothetical protein